MAGSVIHSGCAGWSYPDWKGGFYPISLKTEDFLPYYSKYFNFAEVNSSFYNIPAASTTEHWMQATPSTFRFSVKIWRKITHEMQTQNLESLIATFFGAFSPLESKIACFLLQFPPSFKFSSVNMHAMESFLTLLPQKKPFFLEIRNGSWFNPTFLNFMQTQVSFFLATSYLDNLRPFFPPEQPRYYIRLIKNRELTTFSRIQRQESEIFADLVNQVDELRNSPKIEDIFVIFNNHFRGFSPEDVITFQKRMGRSYIPFSPQKTLDSFLSP